MMRSEPDHAVLTGTVIGAAIVGALWLLSKFVGGHRRPDADGDSFDRAPYDDEPLSPEELARIAQSEAEIARGDTFSWDEVVHNRRATA